jgi:hypothetical protein
MTIRPRGTHHNRGSAIRTHPNEFVPPLVYRPVPVKRQARSGRPGAGR